MTDNITLPRQTAQQILAALRVSVTPLQKDRQEVLRAQAALQTALEQQAEPVEGNTLLKAFLAAAEEAGVTHLQQAEPVADEWAKLLHYPDCWDTAAYPTFHDAVHEALAWSGCSVCKPEQQAEPLAIVDDEGVIIVCSYKYKPGDKLYTTPPQRKPLTDEMAELSNGLAMALHDAVLIRLGADDEATRQATVRIDKLVNKYKDEAAHGIKEGT